MSVLPPTQLGLHRADQATADALTMRAAGAGLFLGRDDDGGAFVLSVLRPEPTVGVLVGSVGLAKLICFRAVAVGAEVVVATSRPATWTPFANLAGGGADVVRIVQKVEEGPRATRERPLLVIVDSESGASIDLVRGVPWATTLSVYEDLSQWNQSALQNAEVAIVQPLSRGAAKVAARAFHLSDSGRRLTEGDTDLVWVVAREESHRCHVTLSSVETWVVGPLTNPSAR